MSRQRVRRRPSLARRALLCGTGAVLASMLLATACADDQRPPPPQTNASSSASSSGGGAAGVGGATASGGGAASGGAGSGGMGSGGMGAGGMGAGGSGASGGMSGVGGSGAAGGASPEDCFDGLDNDLDQLLDCADPECTAACASSCDNVVNLADPSLLVTGDNSGHATDLAVSCTPASGSEVVYQLTAAQTGRLDIAVNSTANLSLSVRGSCAGQASELGCVDRVMGGMMSERELLSVPVTQGQSLFVVVDGVDAAAGSFYLLDVASSPIVCGDGHIDAPGEVCDDGGTTVGDGCDDMCQLESSESEPNDVTGTADVWAAPYYATIAPAADVDVVSIVVPANGKLLAQVFDVGDGGCAGHLLDTYLELIGPDGTTVLDVDDDGGAGYCSTLFLAALSAGTHYIRVVAGSKANPTTFAYRLQLTLVP